MRRWIGVIVLSGFTLGTCAAVSQPDNPVYADDSPLASDTLGRLDDLLSVESYAEAARALQRLLDDEGQRVLRAPEDDSLFLPVRELVHDRLLASASLLERYREAEGPRAQALLDAGDWRRVESARLLTAPGFEAAMRVAQEHLENARFHAALRTLAQLERHPDRTDQNARDAARLLGETVRYAGAERHRELARSWARDAGLGDLNLDPISPPDGAQLRVRSALSPDGDSSLDIESLTPSPLRSETLSPVDRRAIDAPEPLRDQTAAQRTRQRTYAWSMPASVGDVLYVSDGVTVSAWDRFTLGVIWHRRIGPPPGQGERDRYVAATRQRVGQSLEDSASVTISGDVLLTTSGLARSGARQDGGEVFAMDRATGRVLWSADIARLDEALQGSSVRGPLLVDGQTVVVTARKAVRARRLLSQYFVGLDLRTGRHLWTRLVASAGSLPFQTFGRLAEGGVVHEGVVYRSDEIGVVAAVEATSGRPVWVRRFPPSALYSNTTRTAWNTSLPIIDAGSLIMLTPDRGEVVRMDAQTGDILARRSSDELGSPNYLLRVGGSLAMVGEDRVSFVDIRRFESEGVRVSQRLDPVSMSGRCAVSGGLLLAPTHEGVLAIDPARPREARRIPADLTGNLLALPGQLVAIGEFEAHSYLVWDTASALLQERMRQAPSDPIPSATFAELAYHSGRHDQIAPALDQTIVALRRPSAGTDTTRLRARLFNAVLEMVREDDGARGPGEVTSLSIRRALIDRLARIARTPEQRVAHLMARGRLHESVGEADEAALAYQGVLSDESLASSTWHGSALAVRAELEASRRIERVVLAHGVGAYRAFDAEARIERDLLGDEENAQRYVLLARRYPVASVTPELWRRAASAYSDGGRPHAAERALRSALGSAATLSNAGAPIDGAELGEITGRLMSTLAHRSRASEAQEILAVARGIDPGVAPTLDGAPIDLERLASSQIPTETDRPLPVIGTSITPQARPALLTGEPMRPESVASWPSGVALMYSHDRSEISLHRAAPDGLTRAWRRAAPSAGTLVHGGPESALIAWQSDDAISYEMISLETGERLWQIPSVRAVLSSMGQHAAPGGARDLGEFLAPVDGMVSPRSIIHAIGEQTLIVGDRAGRSAAFDLSTGRRLWQRRTRLARVNDLDVGSGIVAIGGEGVDQDGSSAPTIVALDVRTGEVISPIEGVSSQVRWVRIADSGDLIAGLRGAVVSMNVIEGRVNWMMSGLATEESLGAYLFGKVIVLIDADRALWMGDAEDGRLNALELDTRGRVRAAGAIGAQAAGEHIAISGAGGVALFDREGAVVGVDAIETPGGALPASVTRDAIVMVERRQVRGRHIDQLHLLDTGSAKLISSHDLPLYDAPTGVTCIDGYVLVSVGGATMVIRAPAP